MTHLRTAFVVHLRTFVSYKKRWLIVVFSMGKNQCPPWLLMMFLKIQHQSLSVKKNVHSFPVKKSLFHESLLCMYPSNDICMEKSSQNINYSGALRTPKCVSPDSWKFWDIHNGVKYILKLHLNSWLLQILRDIFDQRNKTVSLRSPLVVLEDTVAIS